MLIRRKRFTEEERANFLPVDWGTDCGYRVTTRIEGPPCNDLPDTDVFACGCLLLGGSERAEEHFDVLYGLGHVDSQAKNDFCPFEFVAGRRGCPIRLA